MTKFIIHGFIDTPLSNWVSDMRDELIIRGSLNVIVVDWAGGSLPLYTQVEKRNNFEKKFCRKFHNFFFGSSFTQATANTRLVGLEIAHLITKLRDDHGLKPEDVHIIGHSLGKEFFVFQKLKLIAHILLGAHTAGYAGERIPGIGRITGMFYRSIYFKKRENASN